MGGRTPKDSLLAKAGSRLYILRICKYYGYPKDQISTLFDSLVFSLILYGIEVWGAAFKGKYLDRVDKFLKRAYRYGYTSKNYVLADIIRERDMKLWKVISEDAAHSLYGLYSPLRRQELSGSEVITLYYLKFEQRDIRDLLLIDVYFSLYRTL